MGKSIIHCAQCGKAIREDDFAGGKASMIDSMSYCSDCRSVSPAAPKKFELQKSSTSRIPVSERTPRSAIPAVMTGNARLPLYIGAALVGVGLIVLLAFVLGGKGGKERVPEAPTDSASKPAPLAKEGSAVKPTPAAEKISEETKPDASPTVETSPKATEPEKGAPLQLRLTSPIEGAKILAPADLVLEAQLQDPGGRIARVEFWQGSTRLGEAKEAPYRLSWKGAAGSYELKARAIDRSGAEVESASVRVRVETAEADVAKAAPEAELPKPAPAEPSKEKPAAEGKGPAPKKDPVPPPVDQKKVDAAIKKGINFLVAQVGKMGPAYPKDTVKLCRMEEFVLWTFVHAGVSETSPVFRHLFKTVTEADLKRTYEASLQAMILEEIDRVRYQDRIFQCAQFLVDNQCPSGQWHYGEPVPPSKDVPSMGGLPLPTGSRTSGGSAPKQKPLVVRTLKVTPRRNGPNEGDNSNAQYAALGIRSCADAGIIFPEDTLRRARKWLKEAQHSAPAGGGSGVATGEGPLAPPAGWCYMGKNHEGHNAFGSMTAGAVGGLAIYDTLLGDDWRKDAAVSSGLSWLSKNFGVSGNPGPPSERWCVGNPKYGHFYFLYALERAGVLCRTEWMGRHPWYSEGATFLLAEQDKDGSWNGSVTDTCFAILFLKRATRPLEDVASLDDKAKK